MSIGILVELEVIVHAEADGAEIQAIIGAGERVVVAGQADVEIFDLRGPVLVDPDLGADADGIADRGLRLLQAVEFRLQAAEGETAGAVDQDVIEGVTDAAARGAEPRVGKLVIGEAIIGAVPCMSPSRPNTILPLCQL